MRSARDSRKMRRPNPRLAWSFFRNELTCSMSLAEFAVHATIPFSVGSGRSQREAA